MAKGKVTITLDRSKADLARTLVGARSTSETIDIALDRLLRAERLRRDVSAYRRVPATDEEVQLGTLVDTTDLTDETDWEAMYEQDES